MKTDLLFYVLGLASAEALYLFRKVISTWASAKIAKANAEIAKVTTPAAPVVPQTPPTA